MTGLMKTMSKLWTKSPMCTLISWLLNAIKSLQGIKKKRVCERERESCKKKKIREWRKKRRLNQFLLVLHVYHLPCLSRTGFLQHCSHKIPRQILLFIGEQFSSPVESAIVYFSIFPNWKFDKYFANVIIGSLVCKRLTQW